MACARVGSILPSSTSCRSKFRNPSLSATASFQRLSAAVRARQSPHALRVTKSTKLSALSTSRPALKAVLPSPRGLESRRRRVTTFAVSTESVNVSTEAGAIDYFAGDDRPIVLYDGVCNMCNGGVNFALDADPQGRLRFAALQSDAGRALLARSGRSPDDISSIVLVERDGAHIKSDAVLRIALLLDLPYPPLALLAFLAPRPLRDVVYDGVANNRYSILGMRDVCRLSDNKYEDRFIS